MRSFLRRDRRRIQQEPHYDKPPQVCDYTRTWNNQRCTNTADVIINGIAICAECANRIGAVWCDRACHA